MLLLVGSTCDYLPILFSFQSLVVLFLGRIQSTGFSLDHSQQARLLLYTLRRVNNPAATIMIVDLTIFTAIVDVTVLVVVVVVLLPLGLLGELVEEVLVFLGVLVETRVHQIQLAQFCREIFYKGLVAYG